MSRNPSERKTIKETQEVGQKTLPGLPSCGPGHCGDNGVMFHILVFHLQFLSHSLLPFFNQRSAGKATHSLGAVQALNRQRVLRGSLRAWSAAGRESSSCFPLGVLIRMSALSSLLHVPLLLRLVFWTPGLQSHHSPQKSLKEAGIYMYRLYT